MQPIHFTAKSIFLSLLLAASSFTALAQPRPDNAGPTPSTLPTPGSGPTISFTGPNAPLAPPMLQGIITDEEYKKYSAFQQQINEDPALKEINAKIAALAKEMQQLRQEANATREKLVAANPEIKSIRDKITAAMRARTSPGPNFAPGIAPSSSIGPGSGPMPLPAKTN